MKMDDCCSICCHKILRHAKNIVCLICLKTYMKCVSIDPDYRNEIEANKNTYYCSQCLSSEMPFNYIDDETEFMSVINEMASVCSITYLSDLMFFHLN